MSWLTDGLKQIANVGKYVPGPWQAPLTVVDKAWDTYDAVKGKGDPYNFTGGGGGGGWKGAGSYDKGGGMGWEDWAQLGLGAAGALTGAYGTYKEGQARDRDFEWNRDMSERAFEAARGDVEYNRAFEREKYDTGRADVQYNRDFRDRSAAALRPEVEWLKGRRYR